MSSRYNNRDMSDADTNLQHHDGFCIWNTNTGTPSLRDTPCKKDVVGEYAASFRKHGLKVGLYYSILEYAFDHTSIQSC